MAVYFLILVGGIVRSTGSGMGCPDWPTCFGRWIPPTQIAQLPTDYKEQYAAYRDKKNQKFAKYLSGIGFQETAAKLLEDKTVLRESEFNATKTWVEYLNRVVGVIIGMLIIGLFVTAVKSRDSSPGLFRGSLLLLVLVIFQGWFGSIVVSTNLTSWTVTVHMFLAVVMVALLVWLLEHSASWPPEAPVKIRPWLVGGMIVFLVQVFLGTQVRETLDRLAASVRREEWISQAGADFLIHRSFSWLVIIVQLGICFQLWKTKTKKTLYLTPLLLILASVGTGLAMAYLAVPPVLQPIHLLIAVVTFGWLFQVFLQSGSTVEPAVSILEK